MTAPLAGIRVLDLSRILAGPWCTQVLADLGAEVIKVERPGTGDDTRAWGPPFLPKEGGGDTTDSAYFASTNRGKKSITLDIADAEGQAIARALAATCDVFVENYKVGDMRRYGLDYGTLAGDNPRLVYCSVTGFGQTGPYRARAGYDFMIQAMGGLMSITGERDDLPGGGPQKCGVPIADLMTGMYAAVAILGALRERDASGLGQHIDMALLDAQVAWLMNHNLNYLVSGRVPQRWGNAHPNLTPYQAFPTKDGNLILAIGNDSQFRKFCGVAGLAIAMEPRFIDNRSRLANRDALVAIIAQAMKAKTTAEWMAALEAQGVPCGPIHTIAQVFADEQVIHRGLRLDLPHAAAGTVPQVANPIRYGRTPIEYRRGPPVLGEHTRDVLEKDLGLDAGRIADLQHKGVI
ncbi:MAG TPA: CaiB/BaiF CoA-transferase family protein [Usitatibacteraceae bacterium]|nr:CaiB/BaiF CoA-transferase family protein [Usitatibacteraceae bacterium]